MRDAQTRGAETRSPTLSTSHTRTAPTSHAATTCLTTHQHINTMYCLQVLHPAPPALSSQRAVAVVQVLQQVVAVAVTAVLQPSPT